ncbi:GntR family transcriptional regulator [Amycolatopsis sp. NPDC047767]|uniref:GntR family transcriptional regulator n=1 Tax=Amycolatopsis sp. NPDC047767 TaxID=3156765 RepID=UPI00345311AA
MASERFGAKDRALAYVKEQVLSGGFPGGELISEGEVAEALGMSRTPVREAFLRLEGEGLLRLYPQRGALVVPVSPDEVRAVLEARLVLEQFAAGKVAAAGPDVREAVFAAMEEQRAKQQTAAGLGEFLEADRAFHTVLVDAAANPILGSVYGSLRDRQMRMVGESTVNGRSGTRNRLDVILEEHQEIAEAVHVGDAEQACEAVRAHLSSTRRALGVTEDAGL